MIHLTPKGTQDDRPIPKEDVATFLQCAFLKETTVLQCYDLQRFCMGRCGNHSGGVISPMARTNPSDNYTVMCSCDSLCQVYGDCCWDFQTDCPEEANRSNFLGTLSHLVGVEVGCTDGLAVIEGRKNDRPDKDTGLDHREPIVTLRSNPGLHFLSRQVLRQFYPDVNMATDIIKWGKVVHIETDTSLQHLKAFVFRGEVNEETEKLIVNTPPASIRPRQCQASFKIQCTSTGHECDGPPRELVLPSRSMAFFCSDAILLPSTSTFPPTSISTSPADSAMTSARQTTVAATNLRSTPKADTREKCVLIPMDLGVKDFNLLHLSLTMSFSDSSGFQVSTIDPLASHWEKLVIRHHGPDAGQKDELVVVCASGLLPEDVHCTRPYFLSIHAVRAVNTSARKIVPDFVKNTAKMIGQRFEENDFALSQNYSVERNLMNELYQNIATVYFTQIRIVTNLLHYDGNKLPVTNELIATFDFGNFSKVDKLILCFELPVPYWKPEDIHVDISSLICDGITWSGSDFNVRHFTIMGDTIPPYLFFTDGQNSRLDIDSPDNQTLTLDVGEGSTSNKAAINVPFRGGSTLLVQWLVLALSRLLMRQVYAISMGR